MRLSRKALLPVSVRVGTAKNNDAALVEPLDSAWEATGDGREKQ